MTNSKYTSLLSSLTAVLTLAFASGVKAAVISPPPIPTVTASTFTTQNSQTEPYTLDDGVGDAYAASFIGGTIDGLSKGIYVNGVDANPDLSTIYNVCFEYGLYFDVFNSNRTGINAPCVTVSDLTIPTFFRTDMMGQPDDTLANLAAGGIDPTTAIPPETPIRSNGLLTALNATLTDGNPNNDVKRVLGEFVDMGGVIVDGYAQANIDFIIPYGFDPNDANFVLGTVVSFNTGTGLWDINKGTTGVSADSQYYMFARFGPTGDTVNVRTPTNLELPEPSAIGGLVLVGAALWLTKGRR